MPIDVIYMYGKFGAFGTVLTLKRNTMAKIFDCVFVSERTRLLTSSKYWIKIFNIRQEEVCR